MSAVTRAVLIGSLAILTLDTIGALASRALEFEYALLTPLSLLVYAGVGVYAARRTASPPRPIVAGGLVALVDSTIGWAVATSIGPGATYDDGTAALISAIMGVTLVGGVTAGLAASFDRRRRTRAREH